MTDSGRSSTLRRQTNKTQVLATNGWSWHKGKNGGTWIPYSSSPIYDIRYESQHVLPAPCPSMLPSLILQRLEQHLAVWLSEGKALSVFVRFTSTVCVISQHGWEGTLSTMLCPGWLFKISRNVYTEIGTWEALFHEKMQNRLLCF